MLHRAKHGLITAKRGWTNSWIYLPVPLCLHLSVSLIHPLVSPRPCRMSEVSRSAAPLRSPFLNVSSTSTYRAFLSSTVEDSVVRARVVSSYPGGSSVRGFEWSSASASSSATLLPLNTNMHLCVHELIGVFGPVSSAERTEVGRVSRNCTQVRVALP